MHDTRQVVTLEYIQATRSTNIDYLNYITNGSTEGNLYGLYLARELHPDCMVYFSQDSHYSVSKNLHFLNMRHIMIRSQPNGEIDYDDLRETLRIRRDVPPIIFANIGTTMKEACDDVAVIQSILDETQDHSYEIIVVDNASTDGSQEAVQSARPDVTLVCNSDNLGFSRANNIGIERSGAAMHDIVALHCHAVARHDGLEFFV